MKSEDRRIQIINATLEIIGETGLQGLTTSRIAANIGLTEAAIYRHFKSKDEILALTVATIGKRLSATINMVMNEPLTSAQKLSKIFHIHMEHIQKNRGVPRVIYSQEVHIDEPLRSTLFKIIESYLESIRSILQNGLQNEEFKKDLNIEVEALRFLSMIQFAAFRYSLSGFKKNTIDEGLALWDFYIKSLIESE